jgi:hypothetical protein
VDIAPVVRLARLPRLTNWLRQRVAQLNTRVLLLFVLADLAFIVAHVLHNHTAWLPSPRLSIEQDRGYAELFQYFKEFSIVLLLAGYAQRKRSLLLAAWSLLFVYVLADDAFALHETWGRVIAQHYGFIPMLGLRSVDFGELAVTTLAGGSLLLLIVLAHSRAAATLREASVDLLLLLMAFACCAVLFDMLHIAAPFGVPRAAYTLLKDGGEMLVMTLILALVFCGTFVSGRDGVTPARH